MNIFYKFSIPVVLLLSLISILPLFNNGFFPMHDNTQVARVYEMQKALRDGMFPVRWSQDLGYGFGYPLFNFYAPLAYYIGALFMLLSFDALTATKLMIGVIMLFSGVGMYVFTKQYFGKLSAVVAALFYVYAPYHALDLYVRGDIAELLAYAFIPFTFLGVYFIYTKRRYAVLISGTFYAAIIISHNLTALMVTPYLIAYSVFLIVQKKEKLSTAKSLFFAFVLGLLLSAFYFVPALLEFKYTDVLKDIGGGSNFRDHFVCVQQLWDSPWGFAGSAPGCTNDGISFRIGKVHVIGVLLSMLLVVSILRKRKVTKELYNFLLFCIVGFLFSVVIMLQISQPLWEVIRPMAFLQFPWRFLMFTSFFSSLLSGACVVLLQLLFSKKWQFVYLGFAATGIITVLVINSKLFRPQYIYSVNAKSFISNKMLIYNASKLSDEYLPINFPKPHDGLIFQQPFDATNNAIITSQQRKTNVISANITVQSTSTVTIHVAYFPAWHVFVDNKEIKYNTVNNSSGLQFTVPKGIHKLTAEYISTAIEAVANAVSLLGILGIIVAIILEKTYGKKTF